MSEGPTESHTRQEKVLPKLRASDWIGDSVREEVVISPGRIHLTSGGHSRGRLLRADYVLIVGHDHPVGVVEAKREYKSAHDALQQAIRYAQRLDAPLAYGTNGEMIVERDLVTGSERELTEFPDPLYAWDKAKQFRGVDDPLVDEWLRASFNRRITLPTSGAGSSRREWGHEERRASSVGVSQWSSALHGRMSRPPWNFGGGPG
jgi:type I restriction enzyme R subunit